MVERFRFPGENAHSNLRFWIVQPASNPVLAKVVNVGDAGAIMIALAFGNGAGKNPWMAVQYRTLATLFQIGA